MKRIDIADPDEVAAAIGFAAMAACRAAGLDVEHMTPGEVLGVLVARMRRDGMTAIARKVERLQAQVESEPSESVN